MKKIKMLGLTIIAIAALILSVGTAHAADIWEVSTSVGYADKERDILPAPIMAITLEQLDALAVEAGYEVVESVNEAVYKQYAAGIGSMRYMVTITADMALRSAVDLTEDFPAAGTGWHIDCDGTMVVTAWDFQEFFITSAGLDATEGELVSLGYTITKVDGAITQYFKGDDDEGVNIVRLGDTITMYKYGSGYDILEQFDVQDNAIANATRLIKFA